MKMPGFTAERTVTHVWSNSTRFAFRKNRNGVHPAMMIQVDGVDYCEGEITDSGVQCYGSPTGGGGGVGPTPRPGFCATSCRNLCRGKRNPSACISNCMADC